MKLLKFWYNILTDNSQKLDLIVKSNRYIKKKIALSMREMNVGIPKN